MEKEVVGLIVYFVGFLICLINMTWIYGNLIKKNLKLTKRKLLLIILLTIVATYIYTLNLVILKMITSIFCLIVLSYYCYHDGLKKCIFYSFIVWGLGMFFDMCFMLIFSFLIDYFNFFVSLPIPLEYIVTLPLQIVYNLISRTKVAKIFMNFLYTIFNKINIYLIFFFIGCLVYVGYKGVLNVGDFTNEIAICIIGVFALWIIIQSINIMYLNIVNKETYKMLQNNNKFYVDVNVDFRTFKHNLLHKLDGVKTYSSNKNKTKKLIDEIIIECNLLKQANIELDKLPNGINGLIQNKLYNKYNGEINVVVDNNITKDIFDVIKAKNYIKLCEVLGVTLDNAIEAMKDSPEKIIYISLDETDDEIVLIVKNSFSSFIDIDKLGTINYTTKGKNHGIGLFSILFKNKIKTKLKIVNNLFETQIVVNKLRKE